MHRESQAGRRVGSAPVVEALEDRQLFALATVHQELHRPPTTLAVSNTSPPNIVQPTVGIQLGLAGLLKGPVFGFDVSSPDAKGNYQVTAQFDANDNAPGIDIDSALAVGDLNGDGLPDVALKLFSVTGQPTPVGEATNERIVPFYNTGKGGFVEVPSIPLDESFIFAGKKGYDFYRAHSGLAIGDVDGDKVGDIVSWTVESVTTVLMGGAQEKFKQEFGPTQANKKNFQFAGLGDLDGDGRADLIGFDSAANSVIVRGWDPKTKQFITTTAIAGPKAIGAPVTDIRVADFNGDGLSDLLFFSDNRYTIGLNVTQADPKSGTPPVYGFSWGTTQTLSPRLSSDDVGAGDVNGDGSADLFIIQDRPKSHLSIIR